MSKQKLIPMPCPFCGSRPAVFPTDPITEGNAWGQVRCDNTDCAARPVVGDGEDIADERGSAMYKIAAIKRWNHRSQ